MRIPRALPVIAALLALGGCKSSAPYTGQAVAIGGGLAVGASLAQRAAGGCYAECTHGTRCNPNTGFCEPEGKPDEVCRTGSGGQIECVPVRVSEGASVSKQAATSGPLPPLLSPATGSVPPPPAEASPGKP